MQAKRVVHKSKGDTTDLINTTNTNSTDAGATNITKQKHMTHKKNTMTDASSKTILNTAHTKTNTTTEKANLTFTILIILIRRMRRIRRILRLS
eukprot:5881857-Pyramimonas_sp.AAC.1